MIRKYDLDHPCFTGHFWIKLKFRLMNYISAVQFGDARGLATAEYAVVAIAATAFAGLLIVILKSDAVRQMLESIIHQALTPFTG